jgi:uncharacterized protein (TIRG00374 family)
LKKPLLQVLKVAGFLALGILLLYFAFRGIALDELGRTLKQARFGWIGLSLLFALLSFFSRARRWVLLVRALGFRPSYKNTYHSLMVGYLSNFALPRLGEVTRCVTLGKRETIPVDSLIGTVIIERVTDMFMLLLIMVFLLFSWMDKFGSFFGEQVFGPLHQKLSTASGGMLLFWLLIAGGFAMVILILFLLRKFLGKSRLVRKAGGFLKGILSGIKTIYTMERKWEFIFHSFLIWLLYIFMTWVVVFSLHETSSLTFVDGVFLLVIGGLGMSAPVTAGFGAFHWITSRGLVVVYGLTLEQGGAYAILAHESNSLLTVLLGAISYTLLITSRKKQSINAKPGHADL